MVFEQVFEVGDVFRELINKRTYGDRGWPIVYQLVTDARVENDAAACNDAGEVWDSCLLVLPLSRLELLVVPFEGI